MIEEILFYDFLPYILLVAICYLFACFRTKNDTGLIAIFWAMLIFSAIRYNVGWDYPAYTQLVEGNIRDVEFDRIEWFSRLTMYIGRYTFTQMYFIINSAIGMLCVYKISKRFSKDPALSLYLFLTFSLFFLMTMNVIRNCTAILVMMYACQMFFDKKYWRYIIFMILAAGFHASAYIGFLVPIIYYAVFKLKFGMVANIVIFVASFGAGKAIEMVILALSDNPVVSAIAYYVLNNTEGSGNLYKYIFYLINLVFLLGWKRLVKLDDMNRLWITLINVGVCFWVALSFQYTLSLRMALSFIIWMIILVPSYIETFKPASRKLVKQCIVIFFTLLFFTNLFLLARAYNEGVIYQASFLPYKVFFFQ